jgi:molybdopterin synthase sulfur carrier subunit
MALVFIPNQMRSLTGGLDRVELAAESLGQLIRLLDERFPGLAARLTDEGQLTRGLAASIDGRVTARGLLARVGPTSEVHFIPAIGGG